MNKLICLIAILFTTLTVAAQDASDKSFDGLWHICAFDINGITWDFKTDVITLPAEYRALGESQKNAMIADIREGLKDYRDGTILFGANNYIEQSMGGQIGSGTYSIETKNSTDYLKIVNDDASRTVDIFEFTMPGENLHLRIKDGMGGSTLLVYCR